MQTTLRLLACAVIAQLAGCTGAGAPPSPEAAPLLDTDAPLNVVLILADDLGWSDLGAYGSTFHETPHLNRLAAEGMRFTDAYAASPVCSPTRANLLTGRHPARIQQTDWIPGQGDEPHQKLLQVQDQDSLPRSEVTIAEYLSAAGYATAHIGKWHLGREGHRPTDQGFDLMVAVNDHGSPPTYFWPYKGRDRDLDWLTATGQPGENLTERLGEEAARFIREYRDRPFFLYLPFYAPHTPLEGRPVLVEEYQARAEALGFAEEEVWGTEGGNLHRRVQSHPVYAAMVETMDAAVGRVLRSLEENGVAQRTVVFFLSDNGGLAVLEDGWGEPPTTNLPLRAGKGWLYEGGIRIPLIVRWPGAVPAGETETTPVNTSDILPTVLQIAGVEKRADVPLDGLSLVPVLRGREAPERAEMYWHYPHYHGSGHRPSSAIRSGEYKLIEWYEDGRVELYDLMADPGEVLDLSSERPEVVARLRKQLGAWLREVGAQVPAPNPAYTGAADRE